MKSQKNTTSHVWLKIFTLAIIGLGFNCSMLAQDLNPTAWPHLKGYWKFQNISKLTNATIGKDLVLTGTHQTVAGPSIGDTAIRIGIGSYYTSEHGMAPNGGGDSVNQYTLMFDFKVLSFKKWHTFFKSDSINFNDGECFIRPITGSNPGRIGVGATGYSKDSINPNQWYRLMISVNLNHYYRYYINGKLLHEGDTQEVDGRFALTPKMIFFGDDNQEDDTIDIASVAVFDTCMSAAEIAQIGSIDPCVANPPKISLGRDTSLCDYNSIVKNVGTGFKKYQWSTGGSTQASATFSKSIGLGKKNIWCKVTDVNNCIAADTFILTFNPSPLVNLGVNQAFCKGYTTKLTAGTDTSNKYLWKVLPSGQTISTKSSLMTDSSGKYMVIVTSSAGCMATDTLQVTVYPKPPKPMVTIVGKTNLCAGESVQLSAPSGYFYYEWNKGVNAQSINCSKNDTLKVRVVDVNNCTSVYSDSIVVKVFVLPLKPSLVLTGNDTICEGDSVKLTSPLGYKQYLWKDGAGTASRYVNFAAWFYLKVIDSNGCQSPLSDSIRLTVISKPAIPNIIVDGALEFCKGGSAFLKGTIGPYKYYWSNNKRTPIDTITTTGDYSLVIENSFGCKSFASNSINITVHPVPVKPAIALVAGDSLKCVTVEPVYSWYLNGVVLGANTRTIKPKSNGYYKVMTYNNNCYSPFSDSVMYSNSSVKISKSIEGDISIYPNPVSSFVTIFANVATLLPVTIHVFDLNGKLVYNTDVTDAALRNGISLDSQNLSKGFYFVNLVAGSFSMNARFVKE